MNSSLKNDDSHSKLRFSSGGCFRPEIRQGLRRAAYRSFSTYWARQCGVLNVAVVQHPADSNAIKPSLEPYEALGKRST